MNVEGVLAAQVDSVWLFNDWVKAFTAMVADLVMLDNDIAIKPALHNISFSD